MVLHQCAEIEEHDGDIKPIVTTEEVEIRKPTKREEKRKRRPRRKRSKRKILGELDLGFDRSRHCYRFDNGFGVFDDRETWRYGMFGRQLQHQVKMPPLNDGMAMKEHLKSWAYAVACTVRLRVVDVQNLLFPCPFYFLGFENGNGGKSFRRLMVVES
ncbi:hypothetical protein D5086_021561 [Populus alba]|uniref:Uncharacterized protein n=1 Tax=Populus alba TaxID=43335 RepID=A0ACC4BCH5_POPAL